MLADDVHGLGAGDQVHGAAHAGEHLAGHDPVGDVALLVDLQRAEEGGVHVAAADHREGRGGVEVAAAGDERDGLVAGVGAVAVLAARLGRGADADGAVLGLDDDVDALGDVVGDQGRQADAEVDDLPVLELAAGAGGDGLLRVSH